MKREEMKSIFDLNADPKKDFAFLTSAENAVDYLESAVAFLDRRDSLKWKWLGLSLFQALYGFSITVLGNGSPTDLSANWKDKGLKLRRGSFDPCYKCETKSRNHRTGTRLNG
jgi:hypothetical protein